MKFKKALVVLLLLCIVFSLGLACASCAVKGVCDECGQTDVLHTYKTSSGETKHLCEFCYNMYKLMGY